MVPVIRRACQSIILVVKTIFLLYKRPKSEVPGYAGMRLPPVMWHGGGESEKRDFRKEVLARSRVAQWCCPKGWGLAIFFKTTGKLRMRFVTPGCHASLSLLVVAPPCHFDRRAGKRENLMCDPASWRPGKTIWSHRRGTQLNIALPGRNRLWLMYTRVRPDHAPASAPSIKNRLGRENDLAHFTDIRVFAQVLGKRGLPSERKGHRLNMKCQLSSTFNL